MTRRYSDALANSRKAVLPSLRASSLSKAQFSSHTNAVLACDQSFGLTIARRSGRRFPWATRSTMTTATHPNIPARLAADLLDTLHRLQNFRADADPRHNPAKCHGCRICIAQRKFDRLCDQLPRKEPV